MNSHDGLVRLRGLFRRWVLIVLVLSATVRHTSWAAAPVAPAGFVDEVVATLGAGDIPTGLAILPDNRILIGTKSGQIRMVSNNVVQAVPVLNLSGAICTDGERGLQSITLDPNFAANGYLYVFYTGLGVDNQCTGASATNRVVRYTLSGATATTPTNILTEIPTGGGYHNAGDLKFGGDGMLYVSTGDGGSQLGGGPNGINNDNARYRSILNGKILRITSDGSIPPDNPYANEPGAVICGGKPYNKAGGWCKETYAWGLRNPFRIAFKADGSAFHINDIGQNHWDEVNLGQAGADYGWNTREGPCPAGVAINCSPNPPGMAAPLFAIGPSDTCSINGAAFSSAVWPAPYADAYFIGDYCTKTIYRVAPGANNEYTKEVFHTSPGSGGIITMLFHPASRALYYTLAQNSSTVGSAGSVRRVRHTNTLNRPPEAVASAGPAPGSAPVTVQFSSAGSRDPDGDVFAYSWNFGDGSPVSTDSNPSHVFNANGTYVVSLTLTDSFGSVSNIAGVSVVVGNGPPMPQIDQPAGIADFSVGESITLSGQAADPEDGVLPPSTLSWMVLLHHVSDSNPANRHTHPYASGVGATLTLSMPQPEDLDAAQLSYLEAQLSAIDANGQTSVVTRALQPKHSMITLNTQPPGLRVHLNELALTAPATVTVWSGMQLALDTDATQLLPTGAWAYSDWSHGGSRNQTLLAPAISTTYLANFSPVPATATALPATATNTATPVPTATATPLPVATSTPTPAPVSNGLSPEAESFVLSAPMSIGASASASGGQFIWNGSGASASCSTTVSGGWASYQFVAPTAGAYRIWARTIAPHGGADSLCVQVDDATVSTWTVPNSTSWVWNPAMSTTYALAPGAHTLRFRYREIGTRLDRVVITTDLAFVPTNTGAPIPPTVSPTALVGVPSATPPGATPTIAATATTPPPSATPVSTAGTFNLEAEAGNPVAPLVIQSLAGASGGRFITTNPGTAAASCTAGSGAGWATYRVNLATAGTYKLWGRSMAANSGSDSFCLQIDGGSVQAWTLPIGTTWAWSTPVPATFTLSAGEHTVRIHYREIGARLDRMVLTNNLGTTPPP